MDDLHLRNQHDRAGWMAVLARAPCHEIEEVISDIDLPPVEIVKPAETGTLMVEGRAGGGGRRFNTGEATVTRCVVRIGNRLGFSYALGRDKKKALLCATIDCLLQEETNGSSYFEEIILPLVAAQKSRRIAASRRAAATKVEFFTMVRGEG